METRARYIVIGLFTLAVVVAGFLFVYWLQNVGGLRRQAIFQIRFESPDFSRARPFTSTASVSAR
jgi:phospholipid/cholesterol/gamma-HCH transport system substrate-binding protein